MSSTTTYHTVAEAAEILGITRQGVWQQIDSGTIKADWILNKWAVSATEIKRLQRERKKTTNGNGKSKAA